MLVLEISGNYVPQCSMGVQDAHAGTGDPWELCPSVQHGSPGLPCWYWTSVGTVTFSAAWESRTPMLVLETRGNCDLQCSMGVQDAHAGTEDPWELCPSVQHGSPGRPC